jgi:hypothetical protein
MYLRVFQKHSVYKNSGCLGVSDSAEWESGRAQRIYFNLVKEGLRPETSGLVGACPNMQHYARVEGIGRLLEEKAKNS